MSEESEFATAWRPEAGDILTGKMIGVEVIDPNGQGQYPCLTIQTATGELRAVHAFHQVLQKELARRRPKVGDELTISYQGKVDGANRPYHSYRVLGGQGTTVNWDNYLPEDERQGSAEPPIPASNPEDLSPLPPTPTVEQKAAENFGQEPPF